MCVVNYTYMEGIHRVELGAGKQEWQNSCYVKRVGEMGSSPRSFLTSTRTYAA